ncbi:YhcN/YlaJ family sporulation lipoprotein [Desulfolucanica intricata]|uniref:YhcN/YlaJ family sporulation lipoprotein n=1 Tax=Desulfolucanica intricata TaxID=1285191 RepID=UPI00082F947D|nr:YhcN/YlaJ family sporulation lipoprotein [Desulfolucanica intricata]
MRKIGKIGIILILLVLLTGCGMKDSPQQKPQPQLQNSSVDKHVQIKPELARKVKEIVQTIEGVEESTAVVLDKDISIAIKVSGFERLRLKSIKEEVHNKVSTVNKDYKIHVTSDKKLFFELQQIEKKISEKKPVSDIEKKLKKINKDMQG